MWERYSSWQQIISTFEPLNFHQLAEKKMDKPCVYDL